MSAVRSRQPPLVPWCRGQHACLSRRRSRVQIPSEPFLLSGKCAILLTRCLASRVSPSERTKEPLVSTSQGYYSTNLLTQEVSQQLRSTMLSCMGLLGIHPLEHQYKVTVGNVARPDFLNCHDSCDFNRLFLSSGHPTGLAVRPSDVAL